MTEEQKTELREAITEMVKYTYIMGQLAITRSEWFMNGELYSLEEIERLQSEQAKRLNELIERG
jgi:hypothetical protein